MKDKNSSNWSNDETLSKEFESVGFYISNHPLKDYEALEQYKVKTFKDFENSNERVFYSWNYYVYKRKKNNKRKFFCYY